MNLSSIFIARPVTTTLLMLGILVFGTLAYQELPVADLPSVDFPTIRVQASLPGASPETMASSVALPLEKQFTSIPGLTSINSSSTQGGTDITLQFDLSRNIDAAAQDVQSMIGRASRQLPPQMPAPPSFQKVNPGDQSIFFLILRSSTLPLSTLDEIAQSVVAQRISMVSGVAQVNVFGSQKYAVRIDVDPRELAARSIGIDEVASSVQNANSNLPTGTIYGEKSFVVQTNGQLMRAAAYGPTIISYRGGNPVRLDEVAHVFDGVENDKTAAWSNGERCIYLPVQKQPGVNVVQVVDAIKALLPSIEAQLPASVSLDVRSDRSLTIKESVHDVKLTLLVTVGLVVLVIFLFLRNLSATLIPSLALPGALVGTFSVMYLLGYSLDNLSLMALTLSVGFVVDDAIVMLENIVRHMEMGKPPMQAAYDGSREIAFTILSMTVSLVAVFIPVLFLGGIVGRLLHEFAITITAAILVSGFVSISLTPMMCSRFLKPPHEHGRLYNAFEAVFDAWRRLYDITLRGTLRYRAVTMVVSIVLLGATVYLFAIVPKGFLPSEDQGRFNVNTEGAQGISFEEMVRHHNQVADIVMADETVLGVSSNVGSDRQQRDRRFESGPHVRRAEAARSAHRERRRGHPAAAAPPVGHSGPPGLHAQPAADQSRWRRRRAASAVSVHVAGYRHRRALQVGAGARGQGPADARLRGRQQRPAVEQSAGAGGHGPRQAVHVGLDGDAGRERALQRLRHPSGLPDLRAEQSVPGHLAGRSEVPDRPGGDVAALRAVEQRAADPARIGGPAQDRRGADPGQSLRSVAVGDDRLQSEAGVRAR